VRVPISKVYRAFPELDPFDDEQCELFVRQATRGSLRRHAQGWALKVLAFAAGLIVWIFAVALGGLVVDAFRLTAPVQNVLVIPMMVGFVLIPGMALLFVRDIWLRRSIKARLVSARCPACEYSLLGLPIVMGLAVCPECGEQLDLERMGLTPKDLMATDGVAEVA
jgi:hypothetical protein